MKLTLKQFDSGQLPQLSAEQEKALAVDFYENQNLQAAQKLVLGNLRFVHFIARKYQGYGLPYKDLVQEGAIGLMKAIKNFDPYKNIRLISFAVYWIRAEINDFVIKNWKIVKIATTKSQRKLFFKLRDKTKNLLSLNQKSIQSISQDLSVPEDDVITMHNRLENHDVSLDVDLSNSNDSAVALLEYQGAGPEEQAIDEIDGALTEQKIKKALASLDARSLEIIQKRWLIEPKATLQELSQKFNISLERVRQVEADALKKLKTKLGNHFAR